MGNKYLVIYIESIGFYISTYIDVTLEWISTDILIQTLMCMLTWKESGGWHYCFGIDLASKLNIYIKETSICMFG